MDVCVLNVLESWGRRGEREGGRERGREKSSDAREFG